MANAQLKTVWLQVPRLCVGAMFFVCMAKGLFSSDSVDAGQNSLLNNENVREGQKQYELWKSESTKPKYGECWLEGLTLLEKGCIRLTRETQHSMALKFTNCFLKESGRDTYLSTVEMSENMLSIYSGFFRHTQNVCYFLMAQVWQEETDVTINKLADNSATVAKQLANSSELQEAIILKQNESIRNQEVLISRGVELEKSLEASAVDVQHMMTEFRESTASQREMIFEVFDRVSSLQEIVMGEFTGFYSLIFYTIAILISYLLTSTPRASGARFWLFVLMTVNVVMERLIVLWGIPDGAVESGAQENAYVYERLWWCRKVFSSCGIIIWGFIAYSFKDYNKINNQLLVEIQQQNADLKILLETGSKPSSPNGIISNGVLPGITLPNHRDRSLDMVDHHPLTGHEKALAKPEYRSNSSTGYESDSDLDSVSSFDSKVTDNTFIGDEEEDFSDNESMVSTSSKFSREGTPALLEELRYLRQATPLREMTPNTSVTSALNTSVDSAVFKRPGRPRGRRSEPVLPVQSHHYNLRSRRGKIVPSENPIVEKESAMDFGKTVKHLEQVALRNRMKAKITMERNTQFFSSDEEP